MEEQRRQFGVIAVTPANLVDPSVAIGAIRAGYSGVLDLEFAREDTSTRRALQRLNSLARGPFGLKLRGGDISQIENLGDEVLGSAALFILTFSSKSRMARSIKLLRTRGPSFARILIEAVSEEEAAIAASLDADGVIAKGSEAGGRVGDETGFVLLQRLLRAISLPVYAQGGIGRHTAGAVFAAGAAGVLLDSQLLLARESGLPESLRQAVLRMDGSETACLGSGLGQTYRMFARRDQRPVQALRELEGDLLPKEESAERTERWHEAVRAAVNIEDPEKSVWMLGQDAAFAATLAPDDDSVCGILDRLMAAVDEHLDCARSSSPLAPDSALARSHGTRFPIVQGPMTRVSDRAQFAAKVAEGGALPFLALALMRAPEVESLLREMQPVMQAQPWGVGILGFVPVDLREQQMEVVRRYRPDFALIAGGRPEQAMALEKDGIPTYLHVPSPGLLKLFLEAGARRFVFEGQECGGHIGPRSSFVLWSQMIDVLTEVVTAENAAEYHVLFAGGIHDDLSAAMVAVTAGPLARQGCKIGVLMGTAYTVTEEAVAAGAVIEGFQQAAVACRRTAVLESGPGHITRCADTAIVGNFAEEKRRLAKSGLDVEQVRDALEHFNIGRLRIATKGITRNPDFGQREGAEKFTTLDPDRQATEGLFMLGQVAALRDRVVSIATLHDTVSVQGNEFLQAVQSPQSEEVRQPAAQPSNIAITGMGCVLPKAPDLQSYWENILDKVNAITEVPEDRWDWRPYFDEDRSARDKIYSKWGGFVDEVAFDPLRYGIPPATIGSIEPLHLLTLDVARAALENAGFKDGIVADAKLRSRTSVILGVGGGTGALGQRYAVRSSLPALLESPPEEIFEVLPEWTEDSFPGVLLNVTAGRVANRFDLGGTNFTVDAACGSSLAAITLAVRELEAGTSDMVIVGGADAFQNPFDYVAFSKTRALSPRGRCATFDAEADGIAISEGVAVLVLRRLADAEREGRRIYAIIQGAAGSSDGRDKCLTAPRPEGQRRALERAYAKSGISPSGVQLIEAHGTGTVVGDRTEVGTLIDVFAAAGAERQACGIGSVKSMIGHTKCTAGAAGLIKVALALSHKVLPPTLNVERPNPEANFPESPFYVLGDVRPWITTAGGHPRRAGVSAFGFGGTNFHVVLEEYGGNFAPADEQAARDLWPSELLLWSAGSRSALQAKLEGFLAGLAAADPPCLRDLGYTLAREFRPEESVRLAAVVTSVPEAIERIGSLLQAVRNGSIEKSPSSYLLRTLDPRGVYFCEEPTIQASGVVFLFPGQGSQYPNMLRDLAVHFSAVRDSFSFADAVLAESIPESLSRYVYPPTAFTDDERGAQRQALTQTDVAQPALGAASIGMLELLTQFGLSADMVGGHSYGEYVALHHAGVFDRESLLMLSRKRGRCMIEAAGKELGTMASVAAGAERVAQQLEKLSEVQVANRNAPEQTVIAGPRAAVEEAVRVLAESGLSARPIAVGCGFHSSCVAPARDSFAEVLKQVPFQSAQLPVFANTTGLPYPVDPNEMRELISDHLVKPVNFLDQARNMHDAGARVFIEVGPGSVLTGLVRRTLEGRQHISLASDSKDRPGLAQLQHLLGQLALLGLPVKVERLWTGRHARKLDLKNLSEGAGRRDLPATTWFINGGNARPSKQPKVARKPIPSRLRTVAADDPARAPDRQTQATNGELKGATAPAARTASPKLSAAGSMGELNSRQAEIAMSTPRSTPQPSSAESVMLQYQQLMSRFLETQQHVMLAYLGSGARPQVRPELIEATRAPAQAPLMPQSSGANGAGAVPVQPEQASGTMNAERGNREDVLAGAPEGAEAPSDALATDRESVAAGLLTLVSERTGYPEEMLDLDLNIEADLGIDSIKRVEILGSYRRLFIPETTDAVLEAMEQVVRQKTLRSIIDEFMVVLAAQGAPTGNGAAGPQVVAPAPETPSPAGNAAGRTTSPRPPADEEPRYLMVPAAAPEVNHQLTIDPESLFLITDDATGVADSLAADLRQRGARALVLRQGNSFEVLDNDRFVVDLTDLEAVRAFRGKFLANGAAFSGVIHCLPIGVEVAGPFASQEAWRREIEVAVKSLFNLAVVLDQNFRHAETPVLLSATRLGGAFGFGADPEPTMPVVHGGVAGLVKTLAKEWPNVRCRCVDFSRSEPPGALAGHLFDEMGQSDDLIEVGYQDGQRLLLRVQWAPLGAPSVPAIELDRSSVVLVTGGARGITAEVTRELADNYKPKLVICGSSPLSAEAEGAEIDGLEDPGSIKAALIERSKQRGEAVQPAVIEAAYRRILKDREIRRNLKAFESAGATVEYHPVDVRDEVAFGAFIEQTYERHGRIDGVIHGAGIIEDKLIGDKTSDSFDRVVDTKTLGVRTLATKVRPESLKFLVFFTSVAGRFGNRGQSDYGAANEIVAKLAVVLNHRWPARVAAISWGPWDKAGMVSEEIKAQFSAQGIVAIDPQLGRVALDREIRFGPKSDADLVWGHGPWAARPDEAISLAPAYKPTLQAEAARSAAGS